MDDGGIDGEAPDAAADAAPDAAPACPPAGAAFGTTGIVHITGWGLEYARDVIRLADGRLVVGGDAGPRFGIVRLCPDGSLDTSFGNGGAAVIDLGATNADVFRIRALPEGKLLVVGQHSMPLDAHAVRLHEDGSVDTTFAQGGHLRIDHGATSVQPFAAAVRDDGSFYLAGHSGFRLWLARYTASGQPDPTFAGTGAVIDPALEGANDIAIQADGAIVAVETFRSTWLTRAARYSPAGVRDSSFGNGGIASLPVGTYSTATHAVELLPDGRITVGGYTDRYFTYADFFAARYTAAGQADPTFAGTGFRATNITALDYANDAALTPAGQLVVAGYSTGAAVTQLVQYTDGGNLDPSFGIGGIVKTPFVSGGGEPGKILVQPDGKIVVPTYRGANLRFTVARYRPDGSLDAL